MNATQDAGINRTLGTGIECGEFLNLILEPPVTVLSPRYEKVAHRECADLLPYPLSPYA